MKVFFSDDGWADYLWWQSVGAAELGRLNALIEDCRRSPFMGLGKPELLKRQFAGYWSRRITSEHRLVYRVSGKGADQQIEILQCRFHYQ